MLRSQGRYAEANSLYREAAEDADAYILSNGAWLLATASNREFRDGPTVVALAEMAVARTNRQVATLRSNRAFEVLSPFTRRLRNKKERDEVIPVVEKKSNDRGHQMFYDNEYI